jgi:hypothetical protein
VNRDHCTAIRKTSFRKRLDYDKDLQSLVREFPSHQFLVNPASQDTFLYQVQFLPTDDSGFSQQANGRSKEHDLRYAERAGNFDTHS